MPQDTSPRQMLDALEEDRARLGERVRMPAWLAPAVALLSAAWIASPTVSGQTATSAYLLSVGGIVLAIYLAARAAGVRHGRLRRRVHWIVGAAGATSLALYSTGLALVSLDLRGWVVLPALAAAVTAFTTTRIIERESTASVIRGR